MNSGRRKGPLRRQRRPQRRTRKRSWRGRYVRCWKLGCQKPQSAVACACPDGRSMWRWRRNSTPRRLARSRFAVTTPRGSRAAHARLTRGPPQRACVGRLASSLWFARRGHLIGSNSPSLGVRPRATAPLLSLVLLSKQAKTMQQATTDNNSSPRAARLPHQLYWRLLGGEGPRY